MWGEERFVYIVPGIVSVTQQLRKTKVQKNCWPTRLVTFVGGHFLMFVYQGCFLGVMFVTCSPGGEWVTSLLPTNLAASNPYPTPSCNQKCFLMKEDHEANVPRGQDVATHRSVSVLQSVTFLLKQIFLLERIISIKDYCRSCTLSFNLYTSWNLPFLF